MVEYKNRRALLLFNQIIHDIHASARITPPIIPHTIVTAIEEPEPELGGVDNTSLQYLVLGAKAKLSRRKGYSDETCNTVTLIVCVPSERFGWSINV